MSTVGRRAGHALAVLTATLATVFGAPSAAAHDPLEATATARIEADQLTLKMTLGSWRASHACKRTPFEECARRLYRIRCNGAELRARSSEAVLRPDGDREVAIVYPRPSGGKVHLTAIHLQRESDGEAGASLAVYLGEKLLTRRMLDADHATVEVNVPPDPTRPVSMTRASLVIVAGALIAWLSWRVKRRRRAVSRPLSAASTPSPEDRLRSTTI